MFASGAQTGSSVGCLAWRHCYFCWISLALSCNMFGPAKPVNYRLCAHQVHLLQQDSIQPHALYRNTTTIKGCFKTVSVHYNASQVSVHYNASQVVAATIRYFHPWSFSIHSPAQNYTWRKPANSDGNESVADCTKHGTARANLCGARTDRFQPAQQW